PFIENIFKDWSNNLHVAEKIALLQNMERHPFVAGILLRDKSVKLPEAELSSLIERLSNGNQDAHKPLCEAVIASLNKELENPGIQQTLRNIVDRNAEFLEPVARVLAKVPGQDNAKLLVRGLGTTSVELTRELVKALQKSEYSPAPEDPEPYRLVILAFSRLPEKDRPLVIQLLHKWKQLRFSAEGNDLSAEITGWSRWYTQQFPKATTLPAVSVMTASSKWKIEELRDYLEKDPRGRKGDVTRGKAVFTKANCIKCHKFGSEGEGLGPDLTTLKSRFQRYDTLEAILDPSKVISDQYRGTVLVTVNGQTISGLAAFQGETITVLQSDGSKITLNKADVESQVASTVSPMPEKLLDDLPLEEIADLFSYLESDPK
ncbi:MAG TPA: c-type cytochrome, partial [Gemmatales bacterium]|nr:c-type cytochrome [Gemmatales bacterium]